MSNYHKAEIKAVMPLYGVETYSVKLKLHTEEGDTKWITVPANKVAEIKALIESFDNVGA